MNEAAPYTRLAGVYDEIVVDPSYPKWAAFITETWGGDPAGVHRVLDVCCGTGLLMAELRERGHDVSGVDASGAMLARARDLLGPGVELIQAQLPELGTEETFDAVTSTFDALNYLNPRDFRRSLNAIGARLRPGGWLIFDLHTDALMEFIRTTPRVAGADHGHRFEIVSEVDAQTRSCVTTVAITRIADGDGFTEQHVQYFHSDDQVREALQAAGFDSVRATEEYTAAAADDATLRATWIARRVRAT